MMFGQIFKTGDIFEIIQTPKKSSDKLIQKYRDNLNKIKQEQKEEKIFEQNLQLENSESVTTGLSSFRSDEESSDYEEDQKIVIKEKKKV